MFNYTYDSIHLNKKALIQCTSWAHTHANIKSRDFRSNDAIRTGENGGKARK